MEFEINFDFQVDPNTLADNRPGLYIVRHGQTDFNVGQEQGRDRVRGWSDVPINAQGLAQAQAASKELAKDDIAFVISSDLSRAVDTAKIIAQPHGLVVEQTMLLRPWNLGKYAGMNSSEISGILTSYAVDIPDQQVDGGESFNDFMSRAFWGLDHAWEKYMIGLPHSGVAVTHLRVIKLIESIQGRAFSVERFVDFSVQPATILKLIKA